MALDQFALLELHEGGHGVVAVVVGRPVGFVSARRGDGTFAGLTTLGAKLKTEGFLPLQPSILQPARVRRSLEADICVSLAGDIAVEALVGRRFGYVAPTRDERREKRPAALLAGLSVADARYLERVEGEPEANFTQDFESAATMARMPAAPRRMKEEGVIPPPPTGCRSHLPTEECSSVVNGRCRSLSLVAGHAAGRRIRINVAKERRGCP
jgi:hypothetical protein